MNHTEVEQWYKEYYNRIFSKLKFDRLKPEDAEDVIQETAIRLLMQKIPWENISTFKHTGWSVTEYLNKQDVLKRGDEKSLMGRQEDSLTFEVTPEQLVFEAEINSLFKKTLEKELANIQNSYGNRKNYNKEIFIRCFLQEQHPKKVAESLGLKEQSVRNAYNITYKTVLSNLKKGLK